MRVLVYGAGAVGGYLGARLAKIDQDVTLVIRPDDAPFLAQHGLTITYPDNSEIQVHPTLATSIRRAYLDDRRYDLVLLTMKSYDVAAGLNALLAFSRPPFPTIVTLQNGIGIEEIVLDAFGDSPIVAGSLTTPLSRQIPHSIRVEREGRGLGLARVTPHAEPGPLVELFNEAGIVTEAFSDYQAMKWSKALLNMVGNATSAIINRHPGAIYQHSVTYDVEMDMLSETLAVMKALRLKVVDLPGATAKRLAFAVRRLPDFMVKPILARLVEGGRGDKMPSFHIDLTAGKKKNEVLYHNGAVAAAGQEAGVPTPVNAALSDTLLKMARGDVDWRRFDGKPQELLDVIEQYRQRAKNR